MRLIPLLTAIAVAAGLYFLVFERDDLLAFARGETAEDTAAATASDAPTNPESTAQLASQNRIGVVALRSEARPLDSAVILRGQTQAARQVEVLAETTSTVISEPLRKGAQVKAGDLLCELDPGTRQATYHEAKARLIEARSRVPEAEARLVEAQARLRESQINLVAAQKLSEGGYASETRLAAAEATERSAVAGVETAKGGLEAARAGIEAAQAAVAAAETEIARLTITAPFDGLLESDTAEVGSLLLPGSLCATVIQLDTIKLVGYVPETEVNRIDVGARAGAELANGLRVQGEVSFVSRSADPTTRTFEVEILVGNADLRIRDGQTADIAISAEGTKAHKLPQSALTLNNDGRLGVRIVREDKTAGFELIDLLRDTADGVWVAGLPDTADVIVVGQDFVTEGVAVEPTYREAGQ
ncbi:efflux RND transporter periplasmic adaptor subunit [Phycobacter azelaicus]|uniref:efflux RND transporter periplasmic adaptor subunit n=1 Tax=Phycobacter azelaicus TaxID=2668075 RepID=UPI001866EEF9|nr:efflux RND transporter periplasmic adaptor subunit [Phycobacter azelaicus]MBE1296039.1 efflux RND transporter periplasmic adaptor subunit [Paracoccaceae bacterium]